MLLQLDILLSHTTLSKILFNMPCTCPGRLLNFSKPCSIPPAEPSSAPPGRSDFLQTAHCCYRDLDLEEDRCNSNMLEISQRSLAKYLLLSICTNLSQFLPTSLLSCKKTFSGKFRCEDPPGERENVVSSSLAPPYKISG